LRTAGAIVWREIEDALSADITEGLFAPGSRLPSEPELARRFGVNRHTVRRALASLRERGVVSIEQGRGTFVTAPRMAYPLGRRTRFSENLSRVHKPGSGHLVRAWTDHGPDTVARELKLAPHDKLIALEVFRAIEDQPISISTHYFPYASFDGIAEHVEKTGSITKALRRMGIKDYLRLQTRIYSREATVEEAVHLKCAIGAAVLVMESIDTDLQGTPIAFGYSRAIGWAWQVVVDG
jgi:GntR family phosphonate transport system transcriptional regulator